MFAELSGDDQWIHVDVERAKTESPFGTTIAHGNLTLSLIDGFRRDLIESDRRQARRQLRLEQGPLPAPVPAGSRVRASAEVDLDRRARRRLVAASSPASPSRSRATRSPAASPTRSAARWSASRRARPRGRTLVPGLLDGQRALHAALAVAGDRAVVRVRARLQVGRRGRGVAVRDHVGAADLDAVRPRCRSRGRARRGCRR